MVVYRGYQVNFVVWASEYETLFLFVAPQKLKYERFEEVGALVL